MLCSQGSYTQELPALNVLISSANSDYQPAEAQGANLRQREMLHVLFKSNYNKLKNNIKYDLLPLVSIHASYVIEGDEIINTIKYETLEDVSTYDCHTMLMDMIQDGLLDVIDNIEQINGFHYTI